MNTKKRVILVTSFVCSLSQSALASEALLNAALFGRIEEVKKRLSLGDNIDYKNQDGKTALHKAASVGNVTVIQELLRNGANPDVKDRWGATALCDASSTGQLSAVQELIRHKADLHALVGVGQNSALHEASVIGDLFIIRELIKAGAEVNLKNKFGDLPFHKAASNAHLDVVQELLPFVKDRESVETALEMAQRNQSTDEKKRGEVVTFLKKSLVELNFEQSGI